MHLLTRNPGHGQIFLGVITVIHTQKFEITVTLSGSYGYLLYCQIAIPAKFYSRACRQLNHMTLAARWMAPRKVDASLSYLVAIARHCLSFANKFSRIGVGKCYLPGSDR